MKRTIAIGLAAVLALGLIAAVLLQLPAVQTKLMDRVIAKRMTAVPEQLFKDDALRAVLCGSAAPMPVEGRAAACVMVIAAGRYYIVDAGNRSTNNLALWRIPAYRISGVMLTHFHSDHIGDLGELNMMTWAQERSAPLQVYGPPGVGEVVDGVMQAYRQSRQYRVAHHGPNLLDATVGQMQTNEIALTGDSATVFERDGLKITMFRVEHEPITPAVGYRFDYKGRSVVVSGDTVKSNNLIAAAQGADVLFHEALARHIVSRMQAVAEQAGNQHLAQIMFDIQDYHASPIEAAEAANAAGVGELVLYHLVPAPPNRIAEKVFMRGVSEVRASGVTLGYDGLMLTLPLGSNKIVRSSL